MGSGLRWGYYCGQGDAKVKYCVFNDLEGCITESLLATLLHSAKKERTLVLRYGLA